MVVEQDPARGRIDIVELPRANDPDERRDRHSSDEQCERDDQIECGHGELRKARERSELARTVNELSGITAAATSGWIQGRRHRERSRGEVVDEGEA